MVFIIQYRTFYFRSRIKYKMAATAGKQLGTLAAALHHQILNIRCHQLGSLLQVRNYAARKGTRTRAKAKKVKHEVVKLTLAEKIQRSKQLPKLPMNQVRVEDGWKPDPVDDVWLAKYHKFKIYPFAEAVECHRETHHPTCYNLPNAYINAFIELHLAGDKKDKLISAFSRTVTVPHMFDHGEPRAVMVFATNPAILAMADEAGAAISGDSNLITKVQLGEVHLDDYTAVVAHPEIMPQLSILRGLMKRKFPNPRTGTLGLDVPSMIHKILHGIQYTATPHIQQLLYGRITVAIGRLEMDANQLEENFAAFIKDVEKVRPKRQGPFIVRTSLSCPPSTELFKIDFEKYLEKVVPEDDSYDSEDDEEIQRSNVTNLT